MRTASPMASFVDVGGTLWPNDWALTDADRGVLVAGVAEVLATPDVARVGSVVAAITDRVNQWPSTDLAERPDRVIAGVLADQGYPTDPPTVRRVRNALNVN